MFIYTDSVDETRQGQWVGQGKGGEGKGLGEGYYLTRSGLARISQAASLATVSGLLRMAQ